MADGNIARLRFLQASARAVFLSSPSTSRHLLTQSTEIARSQNVQFQTSQGDVCTACGSLLLPGWSTSTNLASKKSKNRRGATPKAQAPQPKILSRSCSTCD